MLNDGTHEQRLHAAMKVLSTLRDDPALAAHFGIDGPESPVLALGWERYHGALNAFHQRQALEGAALDAMAQSAASFEAARTAQARLTLLARALFTTPADRDRLGLAGRRADGLGAWLLQAEVFHTNLTPADRQRLATFGVSDHELEQSANLLSQLALDHAACVAAKAAAKAATNAKATAFQELAAFMSPLVAVARGLEAADPTLPRRLHMRPDKRRRLQRSVGQPTSIKIDASLKDTLLSKPTLPTAGSQPAAPPKHLRLRAVSRVFRRRRAREMTRISLSPSCGS